MFCQQVKKSGIWPFFVVLGMLLPGILSAAENLAIVTEKQLLDTSSARSLVLSRGANTIYAAGLLSSAPLVYSVNNESGLLTEMQSDGQMPAGDGTVIGLWSVALAPDGKHVYAVSNSYSDPDLQKDSILIVYSRDTDSGLLKFIAFYRNESQAALQGLNNTDVLVSQDGENVYMASSRGVDNNSTDGVISVYSRDAATGLLTLVETQSQYNGVHGLGGVQQIVTSSENQYMYLGGGSLQQIVVLQRQAGTGRLFFVQNVSTPNGIVLTLTLSKDNRYLYAVNETEGTVLVYARDFTNGEINLAQVTDPIPELQMGVNTVFASPEGSKVYVASALQNSLAIFRRNPVTGELKLIELFKTDGNNYQGLQGVFSAIAGGDGRFIYTAAAGGSQLAVYETQLTDLHILSTIDNTGDSGALRFSQRLDIENKSSSNATGVAVAVPLVKEIGLESAEVVGGDGECVYKNSALQCELNSLLSGEKRGINIELIAASVQDKTEIAAQVFSNQWDLDLSDNVAVGALFTTPGSTVTKAENSGGGGGGLDWAISALLLGGIVVRYGTFFARRF